MLKFYTELALKKLTPPLLLLTMLAKILGGHVDNIDSELLRYLEHDKITVEDFKRWFNFDVLNDIEKLSLFERIAAYINIADHGSAVSFIRDKTGIRITNTKDQPLDSYSNTIGDFSSKEIDIHNLSEYGLEAGEYWYELGVKFPIPVHLGNFTLSNGTLDGTYHFTPDSECTVVSRLYVEEVSYPTEFVTIILNGTLENGERALVSQKYSLEILRGSTPTPQLLSTYVTINLGTEDEIPLGGQGTNKNLIDICDHESLSESYRRILSPITNEQQKES